MTDDYRALKDALGRFATGVTVVSCLDADRRAVALTVNSFASVSLDPPLVLWCIEERASTFETFMAADAYAVSVLRADGVALSNRFAAHGPQAPTPEETETWLTGAPVLRERLAGFDCKIVDRVRAGDHVILVGEVLRFDSRKGAPLLYFASQYAEGPEAGS